MLAIRGPLGTDHSAANRSSGRKTGGIADGTYCIYPDELLQVGHYGQRQESLHQCQDDGSSAGGNPAAGEGSWHDDDGFVADDGSQGGFTGGK